jgi:hypothetical protein
MKLKIFIVVALLIAGTSRGFGQKSEPSHEPTDVDRKLAEAWVAYRTKILKEYPAMIKRLESQPDSEDEAKKLQSKLAAAKAGDIPAPPLAVPLSVGDIGSLPESNFRVVQRMGDSEARVGIHRPTTEREGRRTARRTSRRRSEVVVLLRGFDLSSAADDQEITTTDCFSVLKPESYQTTLGGTRTVFVIKPYDCSAAKALFRKAIEKADQ